MRHGKPSPSATTPSPPTTDSQSIPQWKKELHLRRLNKKENSEVSIQRLKKKRKKRGRHVSGEGYSVNSQQMPF